MGSGGQKQQTITSAGQDFSQSPALRVLAILTSSDIHAVMGFVDDHHVVANPLQLVENPLLLEDGYLPVPLGPGLGSKLDWDEIEKQTERVL